MKSHYSVQNKPIAAVGSEALFAGEIDELRAVYFGQRRLLPVRIRVFLEFLSERIKIGDA